MRKIYFKLIQMALILLVSITVVVSSSYAWMVLSGSPVVTGIQVAVGGGTTILIAPDITETVNEEVVHYPGVFSDEMKFHTQDSYAFLQEVGGLTPVSTADGVHWFLPAYYDQGDKEVRYGTVLAGELKDVADFVLDSELAHANIPASEKEKVREGNYLYLDFWVVSPSADYQLRVSTGDDSGGSFVVDLPEVSETDSGLVMQAAETGTSAAVRVGFLANQVETGERVMQRYEESIYGTGKYTALRGLYHEPNTGSANLISNRFTIYEPNCDDHPQMDSADGRYIPTLPVAQTAAGAVQQDVTDRVTAQLTSNWSLAENGTELAVAQRFQAAVLGMSGEDLEADEAGTRFYEEYLQRQVSTYVDKGQFIKRSGELQLLDSRSTADQLAQLDQAGATEDVYIISLEKNVPQRIRMFIWLEGQDADCVNEISAGSFMVNLELAGSNEA